VLNAEPERIVPVCRTPVLHAPSMRAATLLAVVLALAACSTPGQDAVKEACDAYADTRVTTTAQGDDLRARAQDAADRAADADSSWAELKHDIGDAYARSEAMSSVHSAGDEFSTDDLDAYLTADKRVRADCADAGNDIGPLQP
jgi:hypothetical protein